MHQKECEALLQQLKFAEEKIIDLKDLINYLGSEPGQLRQGPLPLSPRIGQRVRVWAACADMKGLSFCGELGEVIDEIKDSRPFKKAIEVKILVPPYDGLIIDVYPQQCELID